MVSSDEKLVRKLIPVIFALIGVLSSRNTRFRYWLVGGKNTTSPSYFYVGVGWFVIQSWMPKLRIHKTCIFCEGGERTNWNMFLEIDFQTAFLCKWILWKESNFLETIIWNNCHIWSGIIFLHWQLNKIKRNLFFCSKQNRNVKCKNAEMKRIWRQKSWVKEP